MPHFYEGYKFSLDLLDVNVDRRCRNRRTGNANSSTFILPLPYFIRVLLMVVVKCCIGKTFLFLKHPDQSSARKYRFNGQGNSSKKIEKKMKTNPHLEILLNNL